PDRSALQASQRRPAAGCHSRGWQAALAETRFRHAWAPPIGLWTVDLLCMEGHATQSISPRLTVGQPNGFEEEALKASRTLVGVDREPAAVRREADRSDDWLLHRRRGEPARTRAERKWCALTAQPGAYGAPECPEPAGVVVGRAGGVALSA